MTLSIKDSPSPNSPGKPGTPSQSSENKSNQSPRSNPVCLEVTVTIRSLPSEPGGLAQPIREEARTVIVFDNGAVIRSTSNLPIGQTFILSNPNGRDVVCRVASGRNMPSVKGYVEVEFIEPVNDFWSIHQSSNPAVPAASPVVSAAPVVQATPVESTLPPRAANSPAVSPPDAPTKESSEPAGSGPSFDDIAGLISLPPFPATPESKNNAQKSRPSNKNKPTAVSNHVEGANRAPLANRRSAASESSDEPRTNPAAKETLSITSPAPAASRDFMSKGLMAYEKPHSSADATSGRKPLIIGLAAFVLAGVCAAAFFIQRQNAAEPSMNMSALTRTSTPDLPPAGSAPAPEPLPAQQEASAPPGQAQNLSKSVALDSTEREAPAAPVPAVVTSSASPNAREDLRQDSKNIRRPEKNAGATKQADATPSRRPAISALKLSSPTAPAKALANPTDTAAPMTDISSAVAIGGTTPAGLLTAAGRTSTPPSAPSGAVVPSPVASTPPSPPPSPAPSPVTLAPGSTAKTVVEPKLMSSTRPVYPQAARQSNIQGEVTVLVSVGADGKVTGAKALSGPIQLRQAAMESVQSWKYSPGLVDGKPAASQVTVNIAFRLR